MPAVATVISVVLFDSAVSYIDGEDTRQKLFLYGFLYLITYLINDVLSLVSSITVNAGIYEKGTSFFRIKLYEKVSKLPFICFENAEILNQKERAQKSVENETLSGHFICTIRFLSSIVAIVSVMMVLAQYSIWLLPISLLSVFPYYFAKLIRGKEFYYVKRTQAKKTRLLSYLWRLFNNKQTAKEMRIMGFDSYITDKWTAVRDEVNEELWKVNVKDSKSLLLCDGIRIIGYGISIAIVLYLAVTSAVSVGVFGACLTAFLSVQYNMKEFLFDLGRIPEQISYARDYYNFLDLPEEEIKAVPYNGLHDNIKLNDLSFKYPNCENYAVSSLNLNINKGEKIAILGENGSGKTTLSKLILGLYPQDHGEILFDGLDASNFDKTQFYSKISLISQNFVSYNLTLRENIAISDIGRLNDDKKISYSLQDVGLTDILNELGSLDVELGREFGGSDLSGGQWQKLAIARGLFKDSELIILDEPTSALDPLIETEILTKFLESSKDKTAIIISHRVGLCKHVDKIVVMDQGKIVEVGTHTDLINANGTYKNLYTAQETWYR